MTAPGQFSVRQQRQSPLVMHVVTALDFGGVERHMEVIAATRGAASLRHVFVALGTGGASEEKLRALGAEVVCLQQNPRIPSVGAFAALLRRIRRLRPDVVHSHGGEANFHGLLAAAAAGVPVRIAEEIGIPGHSAVARTVFRQVYRLATRVIGVSEGVTAWLLHSREVTADRAVTLENPVLLPAAGVASRAPGACLQIACVGRLEPVKNPAALVQGFARLLREGADARLWIIGDGSQRAALQELVASLGLAERVRFAGFQASPETLLRQCHLYVQPSLYEGFGIALVEAMGCGLPAVSAATGIAPGIISEGEQGWIVAVPDAGHLHRALRAAWLLEPGVLHEMGLRARAAVERRFPPARYLERLEQLYRLDPVAAELR